MIGRSPNLYGRTPVVIENLRHIRMHLRKVRLRNRIRPSLGGKNEMYV